MMTTMKIRTSLFFFFVMMASKHTIVEGRRASVQSRTTGVSAATPAATMGTMTNSSENNSSEPAGADDALMQSHAEQQQRQLAKAADASVENPPKSVKWADEEGGELEKVHPIPAREKKKEPTVTVNQHSEASPATTTGPGRCKAGEAEACQKLEDCEWDCEEGVGPDGVEFGTPWSHSSVGEMTAASCPKECKKKYSCSKNCKCDVCMQECRRDKVESACKKECKKKCKKSWLW